MRVQLLRSRVIDLCKSGRISTELHKGRKKETKEDALGSRTAAQVTQSLPVIRRRDHWRRLVVLFKFDNDTLESLQIFPELPHPSTVSFHQVVDDGFGVGLKPSQRCHVSSGNAEIEKKKED